MDIALIVPINNIAEKVEIKATEEKEKQKLILCTFGNISFRLHLCVGVLMISIINNNIYRDQLAQVNSSQIPYSYYDIPLSDTQRFVKNHRFLDKQF